MSIDTANSSLTSRRESTITAVREDPFFSGFAQVDHPTQVVLSSRVPSRVHNFLGNRGIDR